MAPNIYCGLIFLLVAIADFPLVMGASKRPKTTVRRISKSIAKLQRNVTGELALIRDMIDGDTALNASEIASVSGNISRRVETKKSARVELLLEDLSKKQEKQLEALQAEVNLSTTALAKRVQQVVQDREKLLKQLRDLVDCVLHVAPTENLLNSETHQSDVTLVKRDCLDWLEAGHMTNGVYVIHPDGLPHAMSVFCDMETDRGGWIVFQRRCDGSVNFDRTRVDYRFGFGNLSSEFWLGNEYLHLLTSRWFSELWIDLEDFENETRYAFYGVFSVSASFSLDIYGYSGTAGEALSMSWGDRRGDYCSDGSSIMLDYLQNCGSINGQYHQGPHVTSGRSGVIWKSWKRSSLKRTEMKLRRKQQRYN